MGEYTTTAQMPTAKPRTFPGAGSYIGAVIFPLLGVVLAIVALAKGRTGPGLAVLLTSALGFAINLYVLALTSY